MCPKATCYTGDMLDEVSFRRYAEQALTTLKQSLFRAEEDSDFEVEEQGGVLNVIFDKPPAKFVITPNTSARQIWISALSTSFKLEWNEGANAFVLPKTNETLSAVTSRVINSHLGTDTVALS